jgi:outer membrane protein assembly factor BamB
LRTGGVTESSPVIGSDGRIYVGVNNSVWSISARGEKIWQVAAAVPVRSTVVLASGGICIFASPFRDVMALDLDGRQQWKFYLDAPTKSSPVLTSDGTLIGFGKNQTLYSLKTELTPALDSWSKFRGDLRNTARLPGAHPNQ